MKFRVLINNRKIEQFEETVFLGIILDEHLSWRSHVAHVANKISKSIGIIRKSRFYLQKTSLRTCLICKPRIVLKTSGKFLDIVEFPRYSKSNF